MKLYEQVKKREEKIQRREKSTGDYAPDVFHGFKVFNPDWSCQNKMYTCPGKIGIAAIGINATFLTDVLIP